MEKLKLDVDELVVASFSPAEADQEGGRGTVQAHSRTLPSFELTEQSKSSEVMFE